MNFFCTFVPQNKLSMKIVDTRGEKCPKPIIDTKKALNEAVEGEIFRVITDSKTTFRNLSKFLEDNRVKYTVSETAGTWTFDVNSDSGSTSLTEAEDYCLTGHERGTGNFAVAITSEFMGTGDEGLGQKLMKAFFVSLSVAANLPSVIVFYNSGVKLAMKGSEVYELLREVENKGVEIIICGTCVDHYKIGEYINESNIGDMYRILSKLSAAGSIIRP